MPMTTYLRPKLESLSTNELMALQANTYAHLAPLADWDPIRINAEGILDMILDVLTHKLDEEVVLNELDRIYAL
jgi:hypothetical protein